MFVKFSLRCLALLKRFRNASRSVLFLALEIIQLHSAINSTVQTYKAYSLINKNRPIEALFIVKVELQVQTFCMNNVALFVTRASRTWISYIVWQYYTRHSSFSTM